MKNSWFSGKITGIKEQGNKTNIVLSIDGNHKEDILKYLNEKGLHGELKIDDGKSISSEQRKKCYATLKDISDYTGDIPEYTKELFKFMFCAEGGQEYFSLSDCSLDTAREFINYIIEFVIMNDIPLTELALDRTDDCSKYLYYSIKHKKCCICGTEGLVYTLDADKNKMCLCNSHYDIAKVKGLKQFSEIYKVYGISYLG